MTSLKYCLPEILSATNFKRPKNREDSSDFDDFRTISIAATQTISGKFVERARERKNDRASDRASDRAIDGERMRSKDYRDVVTFAGGHNHSAATPDHNILSFPPRRFPFGFEKLNDRIHIRGGKLSRRSLDRSFDRSFVRFFARPLARKNFEK